MQETSFLTENKRVLKDIKKFEIFEPFQEEELLNLLSMSKIRFIRFMRTLWKSAKTEWRVRSVHPTKVYFTLEKMWTIGFPMGVRQNIQKKGGPHVHQSFVPCFWPSWLPIPSH